MTHPSSPRPSRLDTPHGAIELPSFFPDATRAVARGCGADDLEAADVQGVMVNVFHLLNQPGMKLIQRAGGAHAFMGWNRPISVDSGGFQALSLLRENPKLGSIAQGGFTYRLEGGGKKIVLTPEKAIQGQMRVGGDICFAFDQCTGPKDSDEEQETSVRRTIAWAKAGKAEFIRQLETRGIDPAATVRPRLFAVVQGGENRDRRRACAEALGEIGFDGIGYGGWPAAEDGSLADSVGWVAELAPPGTVLFGLGIGRADNLVAAWRAGYRMFDCVLPTRDARGQRIHRFTGDPADARREGAKFHERIYLMDGHHAANHGPIEEGCDCLACRRYSVAYLQHLFHLRDGLGVRLATIHNLRFYRRLVAALRGDEANAAP